MSGPLIKPGDRSKIGLRARVFNGGWLLSRVAASAGSLNMGLSDFAIMVDIIIDRFSVGGYSLFNYKYNGVNGYYITIEPTKQIYFRLFIGGVSTIVWSPIGSLAKGRYRIWCFADRDANGYIYINGTLVQTLNIAAANANLDNAGDFFYRYNDGSPIYAPVQLLGWYMWNFGVSGLPDATTRAAIVAQDMANPYVVPPVLSSRPGAATEERLRITFDNHDPVATVISDESPQANHLTIGGGLTVASVCKEFGSV